MVKDYREAFLLDTPPLSSPQRNWVAPPLDYFKVNVDGASSIDGSGISGIGVIVKDEMGRVISALCKALPVHYPAKITKFFALEHEVLLAQEMNISKVIFESDASSVIFYYFSSLSWWRFASSGVEHSICEIGFLLLFVLSHEKGLQQGCS